MHAKKATYEQRKILERARLDPHIWYVQKDMPDYMQIQNLQTKEIRKISKFES